MKRPRVLLMVGAAIVSVALAAQRLERRALGEALAEPSSRDVFAFEAQIVAANCVAVPSP
jgi:hypothetical protein